MLRRLGARPISSKVSGSFFFLSRYVSSSPPRPGATRPPFVIHQSTLTFVFDESSTSKSPSPPTPTFTRPTLRQRLRSWIVPRGYPNTVGAGFKTYYMWAIVAICANSFSTTISTQALLKGFFLESTALTWMLKDIFPAFLSSFLIGLITTFDTRSKYWFLIASVMFQVCVLAEFAIAYFASPTYLFYGGVAVSLGKSVSFLISGITRASFHQHFATHQNLGDLTKCFNSMALVAYTVSSALGLGFVAIAADTPAVQFGAICCSSALSVFTARKAALAIHSRILTRLTVGIIVNQFVTSNYSAVPSPTEVAQIVGIWSVPPMGDPKAAQPRLPFVINPPLGDAADPDGYDSLPAVLQHFLTALNSRVCLYISKGRHPQLVMLVERDAPLRDVLFGVCVAEAFLQIHGVDHAHIGKGLAELSEQRGVWEQRIQCLLLLLEKAGWDCTSHCIDVISMRYHVE